jgi:DNA-binding NtrC family response regulator
MVFFHLREEKMREEMASLRTQQKSEETPFLTTNEVLLETSRMAKQIAPTNLSVLIQGETGTGKELLAKWIHQQSDRAKGPFVPVNCGAIPNELLESLLFGHKKGSFTGATTDQTGKFLQAEGGTLFLDEIGDLPSQLQVKILRALQEKIIEPLGAKQPIRTNVRILCATHKDLKDLVGKGHFREDLYFRLAEVALQIPPLRERPEDIGLLAAHLLKDYAEEKRFSETGWRWLKNQKWPGNVRELMSSVKRAAILSKGDEIQASDFALGTPVLESQAFTPRGGWLGGENLEDAKNFFIYKKVEEALKRSEGKRNQAAELLGITPRTLFRYIGEMKKDDTFVTLR